MIPVLFRRRPDDNVLLRATMWILMLMIVLFGAVVYVSPDVSLAGLGTTLVIMGVIIELNAKKIWSQYLGIAKKRKYRSIWSRPHRFYYYANVYFLWPLVVLLGLIAIGLGYYYSTLVA